MSEPAKPKTLEEWGREILKASQTYKEADFADNEYGTDQYSTSDEEDAIEARDSLLDAIMSLQDEAERLREDAKWCRCIVARGYENEKCRNCGLFSKNPFEKARQAK